MMKRLELAIPPPIITLISAALMGAIAYITPTFNWSTDYSFFVAVLLVLSGFAIALAGVLQFKKARTTLNPSYPHQASVLVCDGIYSYSRNPMYLGIVIALLGWAVFLGSVLSVTIVALFIIYISRFQIRPEEERLKQRFGLHYIDYTHNVRRWL